MNEQADFVSTTAAAISQAQQTTTDEATDLGWPRSQFQRSPLSLLSQRGVIAKANVTNALWTTLNLSADQDVSHVKRVLSLVPSLTKELENEALKANPSAAAPSLSSVIAVDIRLWQKWSADSSTSIPADIDMLPFEPIQSRDGTQTEFPSTPTDLALYVKANRMDLCYELSRRFILQLGAKNIASYDRTSCFRYMDGKDLTGFIDGSRNFDVSLRGVVSTLIQPPAPTAKGASSDPEPDEVELLPSAVATESKAAGPRDQYTGSCFMFASRFVHNIPKFVALTDAAKSDVVGRDFTAAKPCTIAYGGDRRIENPLLEDEPNDCHIQRAAGHMYRQAFPYVSGADEGLYFSAFSNRCSKFVTALQSMAGHTGFGNHDRLLDFTRPATASVYFVPSLAQLNSLSLK